MAIPVVEDLKQQLHDQPRVPLRPHVRKSWEEEATRLDSIVNAPPWVSRGASEQAIKSLKRIRRQLIDQAAKRIEEPVRRDRVKQLADEVLRDVIRPSMQSQAVMRRNPPGAVDGFLRKENAPVMKDAILAWKRAQFALDPDTEDHDHANLEKYRPAGTPDGGNSTFMADAQIPGHFAFGSTAAANWPAGMPPQGTVNHPLAQAQAAETVAEPVDPRVEERRQKKATAKREYRARVKAKKVKRTLNLSPEQRAVIGERLTAARAAKYGTTDA